MTWYPWLADYHLTTVTIGWQLISSDYSLICPYCIPIWWLFLDYFTIWLLLPFVYNNHLTTISPFDYFFPFVYCYNLTAILIWQLFPFHFSHQTGTADPIDKLLMGFYYNLLHFSRRPDLPYTLAFLEHQSLLLLLLSEFPLDDVSRPAVDELYPAMMKLCHHLLLSTTRQAARPLAGQFVLAERAPQILMLDLSLFTAGMNLSFFFLFFSAHGRKMARGDIRQITFIKRC